MLKLIKSAIGIGSSPSREVPREVRMELISSVLLLEAAHADKHCSEKELEHVVQTIKNMYGLNEEYIAELLEVAHQRRAEAVDMHQFTRAVNEQLSRDEKLRLLDDVWKIIYSDGVIDKFEEHFARKLANLLWLEHKDFINAKLKAKKMLGR